MKVSILMITYNHERYISQALNSILMQKVDFDYEIVIGEDCSKDSTRNIILRYRDMYPDKIRLLDSDKNIGMLGNYVRTFQACRGAYIAVLDGDDFWTSPDKLRKQVEYLDAHPECTMCFHPVSGFHEENGETVLMAPHYRKEEYELGDLLAMNFILNSSVMYRNGILVEFPSWWFSVEMTDWTTHILHAQHGGVGFIDENMGVYRIHSNGVWSTQNAVERIQGNIKVYDLINKHLNYIHDKKLRMFMSNGYFELSLLFYDSGNLKMARDFVIKCFTTYPFNRNISRSVQIKTFIKLNMVWLYDRMKTNLFSL